MIRITIGLCVAVMAVLITACGDSTPEIELGEGQLPETVPSDFPIPATAVIGPTLMDNAAGRTEVSLRVPASVAQTAQSFELNLVSRGFVVANSSETQSDWKISFHRDDVAGEIVMSPLAETITMAVVEIEH